MLKNEQFYVVTGQVLPLLFIAAAIESRYFSDKALTGFWYSPAQHAAFRGFAILAMVWGEVEALLTLYRGHEGKVTALAVVSAYYFGGLFVVGPFFNYQMKEITRLTGKSLGEGWAILISFLVLAGYIGILVFVYVA